MMLWGKVRKKADPAFLPWMTLIVANSDAGEKRYFSGPAIGFAD
jgi:hypothetical protein